MINLLPLQFEQATCTTQTRSAPRLVSQCLHYILAKDFLQCAQFKMSASCQGSSLVYQICFLGSHWTMTGVSRDASRMFCAAYHPKSEGWGREDRRGISSFTPQEVSLTATMRQMPGERGQPYEGCPLKELPSGLKEYQVP